MRPSREAKEGDGRRAPLHVIQLFDWRAGLHEGSGM